MGSLLRTHNGMDMMKPHAKQLTIQDNVQSRVKAFDTNINKESEGSGLLGP